MQISGKTVQRYNLLNENDRILVGFSGGKDSYTLLRTLSKLLAKSPAKFKFEAIFLDPLFEKIDYELLKKPLENICKLNILAVDFNEIISAHNHGNYCSFCSRIRRGHLYSFAKKNGFNKLALGHHLEDTLETFLLNIFFSGQIKVMPPTYQTDDQQLTVIRPLIEVPENLITNFVISCNFKTLKNNCLFNQQSNSQRQAMKELLNKLESNHHGIKANFLNALKNVRHSHLF